MEHRTLKTDVTGFAHNDVFCDELSPREAELFHELSLAGDQVQATALLACLRHSLAGPQVIPMGAVVDVLAKAGADAGDIFLIVRSAAGVYAQVLDSQTEPSGRSDDTGSLWGSATGKQHSGNGTED